MLTSSNGETVWACCILWDSENTLFLHDLYQKRMSKKKNQNWTSFLSKMRFRYRISVMNENTLEESWFVRLSRFSVFLWMSLLIFVTFIALTLVITFTPMKYYLPGYIGDNTRSNTINESMTVDSLLQEVKLQSTYLDMISDVIAGRVKPDSVADLDSVALKERAQVKLDKREEEANFVSSYEEAEKYNLASLSTQQNDNIYVFFKPVSGVISMPFDLEENHYGISIVTSSNETVVAVLMGVIINTSYTFDSGSVIQVQHDNGYVSIYKNCTALLKKVGDQVRAGEAIAFTGDSKTNGNISNFEFQLWRQGKPVNPEDLIVF